MYSICKGRAIENENVGNKNIQLKKHILTYSKMQWKIQLFSLCLKYYSCQLIWFVVVVGCCVQVSLCSPVYIITHIIYIENDHRQTPPPNQKIKKLRGGACCVPSSANCHKIYNDCVMMSLFYSRNWWGKCGFLPRTYPIILTIHPYFGQKFPVFPAAPNNPAAPQ